MRKIADYVTNATRGEIQPGMHCEHCSRHRQPYHDRNPSMTEPRGCKACLPESTKTLPCCNACKVTFYCSKECQKANWRTHKKHCKDLAATVSPENPDSTRSAALNPGWCTQHAAQLNVAAVSALALARSRDTYDTSDHSIFVVELDVKVLGTPPDVTFVHTVRDARCDPWSAVRERLDNMFRRAFECEPESRVETENAKFAAVLVPRPGKIPTLIFDNGARYPYNCALRLERDDGDVMVRGDWFTRFKQAVDPRSPSPALLSVNEPDTSEAKV